MKNKVFILLLSFFLLPVSVLAGGSSDDTSKACDDGYSLAGDKCIKIVSSTKCDSGNIMGKYCVESIPPNSGYTPNDKYICHLGSYNPSTRECYEYDSVPTRAQGDYICPSGTYTLNLAGYQLCYSKTTIDEFNGGGGTIIDPTPGYVSACQDGYSLTGDKCTRVTSTTSCSGKIVNGNCYLTTPVRNSNRNNIFLCELGDKDGYDVCYTYVQNSNKSQGDNYCPGLYTYIESGKCFKKTTWYEYNGGPTPTPGPSDPEEPANINCEYLFGDPDNSRYVAYWMQWTMNLIKYLGIIALFVMSTVDFVKALVQSDQDALKKAATTSVKRFIFCVLLFFLPIIVDTLMSFLGAYGTCNIG